jgi:hypothetical protein
MQFLHHHQTHPFEIVTLAADVKQWHKDGLKDCMIDVFYLIVD